MPLTSMKQSFKLSKQSLAWQRTCSQARCPQRRCNRRVSMLGRLVHGNVPYSTRAGFTPTRPCTTVYHDHSAHGCDRRRPEYCDFQRRRWLPIQLFSDHRTVICRLRNRPAKLVDEPWHFFIDQVWPGNQCYVRYLQSGTLQSGAGSGDGNFISTGDFGDVPQFPVGVSSPTRR